MRDVPLLRIVTHHHLWVGDSALFALPWNYHSECAPWLPLLNPS
jgi:hypothetical protein